MPITRLKCAGFTSTRRSLAGRTYASKRQLLRISPWVKFRAERGSNGAQASGCTLGTDGPSACLKWVLARAMKVPRQRSATGSTTLKFLCM